MVDELASRLADYLDGSPLAGEAAAVAVSRGRDTRYWCAGALPGSGPVTPDTVMYAASLTKQLVGALTASAVDQNALAYDSRVRDLVPELPPWSSAVRVQHLLHHTSGLPAVTEDGPTPARSNAAVLARLRVAERPSRLPGQAFEYSNTGYVLLAVAVERALGQPIEVLARERLFSPLAMRGSRLGGPAPVLLPGLPEPPLTVGDGGWWTTVSHLSCWLNALNTTKSALARTLERPGVLNDGSRLDYGWGVRVSHHEDARTVTHGGSWPGWLAKTVRQPENGVAVAVLSSSGNEQLVSDTGMALASLCSRLR